MLSPLPQDSYSLPAKLERFEGEFAVLRNEIIGEFKWPTKKLPQQLQVGETVVIKINTAQIEKEEEYSKMRKLLEELIN
jgi:hypothetical protein